MIEHHENHQIPRQDWTTFHGKISILQQADDKHDPDDDASLYGDVPRTSLLMELTDRVGVLHDVLRYFWKYDINISRIESRPIQLTSWGSRKFDFYVDLEGSASDPNVSKLLQALAPMTERLLILDEKSVHWFPRHISELDLVAGRTLDAGVDLEADHPGFHDGTYRARRALLTESASRHRWNKPIERIHYTPEEISVWTAVWDRMEELWNKYACKEYLQALKLMKEYCGYGREDIPQQQDISNFLLRCSNFRLRPVAGLLSSRDFLNGLAFRVFFSTQYIRHHSKPLYTPEPDICHELLGHVPMFADRDFADFSQEIGLASLGASDEEIEKLARVRIVSTSIVMQFGWICYWKPPFSTRFPPKLIKTFMLFVVLPSATGIRSNLVCVKKMGRTRHTERGFCHRLGSWSTRVAKNTPEVTELQLYYLGILRWPHDRNSPLPPINQHTLWPRLCRMQS